MAEWSKSTASTFEPTIFKPNGKTPRLMTREFVAEAERLVAEIDKIEERHKDEIRDYLEHNPQNVDGLEPATWRNRFVVDMIVQLGKPERFDYEFDEISEKYRALAKSDQTFDFTNFFIEMGPYCSVTPLYKTIWSAQGWLDTVYLERFGARERAEFDVALMPLLRQDAALLRLYAEIWDKLGEDQFLQIVGAGDPDQIVR